MGCRAIYVNNELTLETSLEVECELGLNLWLSSASTDYVIADDPSRGHVDLLKLVAVDNALMCILRGRPYWNLHVGRL